MTPNIYCNADAPILELPIGMVQYIYIEESPCNPIKKLPSPFVFRFERHF